MRTAVASRSSTDGEEAVADPARAAAHEVRNLLQVLVGQTALARHRASRGEDVNDLLAELEQMVHALAALTTRA